MFVAMIKNAYQAFVPRTIVDLDPNPPGDAVRTTRDPNLGLDIASWDYEDKGIPPLERPFVEGVHLATPLTDPNARWASAEEAEIVLGKEFHGMLDPTVVWPDPTSDATLSLWVTQGLAAHMLEASRDGFVVDLSFMSKYKVREGFEPYGATLHLSSKLEPVAIDWQGDRVTPTSHKWETAKLVFRSSVATAATLRDHAVRCHMLEANGAVVAARRSLPATHPIRHLLMPFQYRTPTINWDATLTLIGEKAIFNRLFALEWPSLQELYGDCIRSHRMQPFPEELERKGVADVEGYAYAADGLAYWAEIQRFVDGYVSVYYDRASACPDDDIVRFANDLRSLVPTAMPVTNRAELVELCSQIIFNATAFHQQVGGSIGDNVANIGLGAPAVRVGPSFEDRLPSRNTMYQAYMLGALTNLGMPRLLEDFSHVMLDEPGRQAVVDFQVRLRSLSEQIDAKNAKRTLPMVTFDPNFLEVSVAI
jgi:Lipoxygenase